MLFGIVALEFFQIDQFPAYGWQRCCLGQSDQVEVRFGIVKGQQEGGDVTRQALSDIRVESDTRFVQ